MASTLHNRGRWRVFAGSAIKHDLCYLQIAGWLISACNDTHGCRRFGSGGDAIFACGQSSAGEEVASSFPHLVGGEIETLRRVDLSRILVIQKKRGARI